MCAGPTTSVSFNPNLKQLASGGEDNLVMVWNFKANLRAFKFQGHTVRTTRSFR